MRIKTLKQIELEKNKKLKSLGWHEWFAWHPVVFDGTFIWLENIERSRWFLREWQWDYRSLKENK